MQIKEAAAKCGLTEKAIRLYEEKGLITPSYTEINGRKFRDYDDETVAQLQMIAGLRQSFFSLDQIAAMQNTPEDIPAIFSEYRDELRGKFHELEGLLERADAITPASLTSADALAQALSGTLAAPAKPEQITADTAQIPTDEPYRIRRVETHAVPEMRFRVWDEDVDRDAREAAYRRYLNYAQQWAKSYDHELKVDKIKHFWLYPIGKFIVLPLLCLAIIGCFLYFVGWWTKVDITYSGYEITFSEDVWNEINKTLDALPEGAVPHEMDVSGFPQAVEAEPISFRYSGWLTKYLIKASHFEGYIHSEEFGAYDVFRDRLAPKNTISHIRFPDGKYMPGETATTELFRTRDRAKLWGPYIFGTFRHKDAILIYILMEPYQNTLTGGKGYRSTNTYIVLGADSPEEASHIFWDRLWRSWQEDIYEDDPDYFRNLITEAG